MALKVNPQDLQLRISKLCLSWQILKPYSYAYVGDNCVVASVWELLCVERENLGADDVLFLATQHGHQIQSEKTQKEPECSLLWQKMYFSDT